MAGRAGRFDRALGYSELLLRRDQSGRKTLEIAGVLALLRALTLDAVFEAADIERSKDGDSQADEYRHSEASQSRRCVAR
jgi:hypothetical protein